MVTNLEQKKNLFGRLNEEQKRLFAGIEAKQLGRSGVRIVSAAFDIHPNTIRRGISELGDIVPVAPEKIRKPGGGRKKKIAEVGGLVDTYKQIVLPHTAGLPTQKGTIWCNLSAQIISDRLRAKGFAVTYYILSQLAIFCDFHKRSHVKSKILGVVENRDEQFERINTLREAFLEAGQPVISMDTKNKELLGEFARQGACLTEGNTQVKVLDHDFRSSASGILVPHGIYDVGQNKGYITLGSSRDTSLFACDNLSYFWQNELQWQYPNANYMLLLLDSGGSNNCRHHIFKYDLLKLAEELQMTIVVAHYPTNCSKWNPIEHRLFCHVSRAWEGAVFENIELVKELTQNTKTKNGLSVKVHINTKQYELKRKAPKEFLENEENYIHFEQELPKWNYTMKPAKAA